MNIFGRIFGGESEQEPAKPQPLLQETIKQKPKQAGGELPQKTFTSESQETPRVVRAQQYILV